MASRDLSAVTTAPCISRFDSTLDTAWQEVKIPPWCDRIIFYAENALYLSWYGHDGAAVGTHRLEIDAGGSYELTINPPPKLERAGLTDIDAVYIAAQSGSSKSAALVLCAGGS